MISLLRDELAGARDRAPALPEPERERLDDCEATILFLIDRLKELGVVESRSVLTDLRDFARDHPFPWDATYNISAATEASGDLSVFVSTMCPLIDCPLSFSATNVSPFDSESRYGLSIWNGSPVRTSFVS